MNNSIISFNISKELVFTDEIAKALGLPEKDSHHPLNIDIDRLDPNFEYRWKAYGVSENTKHETSAAQEQIINNLERAVLDGWMPVHSLDYPFLLTPAIRKYSNKFIRYNGLLLCCKLKQLGLGFQSMGAIKDGGIGIAISFSTPLLDGKQIYSIPQ